MELAEDNTAHFTPANRERYTTAHKAALAKALEAFALTNKGDAAGAKAAGDEALGAVRQPSEHRFLRGDRASRGFGSVDSWGSWVLPGLSFEADLGHQHRRSNALVSMARRVST